MSTNLETISQATSNEAEQRPQGTPIPNEPSTTPELLTLQPENTDVNPHQQPALPSQGPSARLNLDEHLASEETHNPEAIQPVEMHPDLPINQEDVYNWSSHLQDQQSTPRNTFPAQRLQSLTQSEYKRDLHITHASPSATHQRLDRQAHQYFRKTQFSNPKLKAGTMSDTFVNYLQFLLSIPQFPPKLKLYLELGQMHLPHLLVNAFGGSFKALGQRLCGINPSFFLYNNQELTKKLILFSCSERKFGLTRTLSLNE